MNIYRNTKTHLLLISIFIITGHTTHTSDYWQTIRSTPSYMGQLIMRNKIRTALLGAGAFSLYYIYNAYIAQKNCLSPTQEAPTPLIIPPYEPDEAACDKDVCFYKFTGKKWRDAGDIRREMEKPENFSLLTSGFVKPLPNVNVKEGEHPNIYDIRNILLPPEPLLDASRGDSKTRWNDARKYQTAYNKMTYIMRKKDTPHDFVGFTTFYKKPYNNTEAHIDLVLINKKFRGKGYGPLMLNFAFDAMKKMGITKVELITSEENKAAQHLYEKVGFTKPLNQPYRNQNHISYERNI